MTLVDNGKVNAKIVIPNTINRLQKVAIDDFVKTIEISSGTRIPIIEVDILDSLETENVNIIIGPSNLTDQLGYSEIRLEPEEFQIITSGNNIIVLAEDIIHKIPPDNIWFNKESENTRVTQWALGYILDRYVGVKWLWPGEVGTYIPKIKTITLKITFLR